MTHKLTADGAACVTPDIKWLRINERTPIGTRIQIIDKAQNIAYIRQHYKGDGFTHWLPLATFDKDEE